MNGQHLLPHSNDRRSRVERVADAITVFCGNIWFIIVHIVWFGWWIAHNLLAGNPFDPWPFGLLTLIVSLEAILLSSFILLSQRRDTIAADRRAEYDLSVNVRTESHAKEILLLLKEIHAHQVGRREQPYEK